MSQTEATTGASSVTMAPTRSARFWRGTQNFIRWFPIIGHLPNCTLKNHVDSLKEFLITILFGTATFWVTALLLMGFAANKSANYLDLLYKTTSSGQLFIFTVGMLGPILLASAEEPPNTRQFPGRASHFALILLLGALASGFYATVLAGRDPKAADLVNSDFLFGASLIIALFVVAMRYLTIVYRKNTSNFSAEERLKRPEEEFAADFEARHASDPLSDSNDAAADAMVNLFNGRGTTK